MNKVSCVRFDTINGTASDTRRIAGKCRGR
jgi:hypothetical protein